MDYTTIEVPNMNDSMSFVTLNKMPIYLRFTYNDTGDYWKFGIYDALGEPVLLGIKIVPQFPLNLFQGAAKIPFGVFGVLSKLDRIGRYDFRDGNATFVFAAAATSDPAL